MAAMLYYMAHYGYVTYSVQQLEAEKMTESAVYVATDWQTDSESLYMLIQNLYLYMYTYIVLYGLWNNSSGALQTFDQNSNTLCKCLKLHTILRRPHTGIKYSTKFNSIKTTNFVPLLKIIINLVVVIQY